MLALSRQKLIIIFLAVLQLLLIPIVLWLVDWHWSLDDTYDKLDSFLFFITETGTAILYASLTCLVFSLVLYLCNRSMPWITIMFTIVVLVMSTQVIKSGLKSFYKEPRPYTEYLVEQGVDMNNFYNEKRSVRQSIVKNAVKDNSVMPEYLKKHWAKEVGYSFPSAHTAFAVTLMMVFALILPMNRKRDWFVFSIIVIWAALMIASRIRFGMHYPIDVFVSTIYVPIVCLLYAKLTQWTKLTPYFERLTTLPNQMLSLIQRR